MRQSCFQLCRVVEPHLEHGWIAAALAGGTSAPQVLHHIFISFALPFLRGHEPGDALHAATGTHLRRISVNATPTAIISNLPITLPA